MVSEGSEKRRVCILGSTGSVGTNTLNIIRQNSSLYDVVALACGNSLDILLNQIQEFKPEFVSVGSPQVARDLRQRLLAPGARPPHVFYGIDGHRDLVRESEPDVLIGAMAGIHGLQAVLQAVRQNVPYIGIANKEILVMAGSFILDLLKESRSELIPVDSEHSAVFQALMGNEKSALKNIILTGSGGPFRTRDVADFKRITKAEALKHPNWVMGAKITIDSATMMNKGLEFIEAIRLFQVERRQIKILIHPESIIHSMVEYCDGSFMAQLGISDMRIPISLALAYPKRLPLDLSKQLDLVQWQSLHFESPDYHKFPCLRLAMEAEALGTEGPIILNAANEVAVQKFLIDHIEFTEIASIVEQALNHFQGTPVRSLEEVIELDERVRLWTSPWNVQSFYSAVEV